MSLKQQRRPLPFLLYFSFFYGENVLSTVKIRTVALYWSNRNNLKRAFCWEQNKFWIEWIADCFSPSFRSDLSRGQSEQLQQLGPRGNNGGTWLAAHAHCAVQLTVHFVHSPGRGCFLWDFAYSKSANIPLNFWVKLSENKNSKHWAD